MYRTNSNPNRPQRRRSFKGWLKRMTLPNNQRRIEPQVKEGVFGVPLNTSIEYAKTTVGYIDEDGVKHSKAGSIPIVVAKCGSFLKKNGLETEGIFRVSGNMKRVNALEFQFDQGASHYGLDFNWDGYTVHDAANLLTRYLNKLPEPVIPTEYYLAFRDVMNNNVYHTTEERIDAFQALIQDLPPPHRHLLLYLLDTLSLFAANASQTKMTTSNIAAVFCPGILRHPDYNTPIQYKISQCVIEFLIEFQSLFTVQLLDKKKRMSTASSEEVPWLVPSMHQPTPPLPLRVVNGSVHSESSEESPKALMSSPTGIDSKQATTTSRETNQPLTQKLKDTVCPWIALNLEIDLEAAPQGVSPQGTNITTLPIAVSADVSKTDAFIKREGNLTYYEHSINFNIPQTVKPGNYHVVFFDKSTNTKLSIPIEIRPAASSTSVGAKATSISIPGRPQSSGSIFAQGAASSIVASKALIALMAVAGVAFLL
ncbi:hypothetical protein RMATCC62417_12080 [Rhizopus microsporus]|nr:hypothetical protein RMATCC62417_12080 [Rhizopus microsporus]